MKKVKYPGMTGSGRGGGRVQLIKHNIKWCTGAWPKGSGIP